MPMSKPSQLAAVTAPFDPFDVEMTTTKGQKRTPLPTLPLCRCGDQAYIDGLCKRHADLARYQAITHAAHGRTE
jgi:hypothetical protein